VAARLKLTIFCILLSMRAIFVIDVLLLLYSISFMNFRVPHFFGLFYRQSSLKIVGGQLK
jgi:hypothetical protein